MAISENTKNRLNHFAATFKKLNDKIDRYHTYQPWLIFKVQNQYDTGLKDALTIDTFNSCAYVTTADGKSQKLSHIMLMNFEYNKNGSAKANTFTISFTFNPAEKIDSAGNLVDPEIIDKALVASSYFMDDGESTKAVNAIGKHRCYLRYGYNLGDGDQLMSENYFGQALKASSELRDGLIYYTITGYSSITYAVNLDKIDIQERGVRNETTGECISGGWKTSDAVWEAFNMYFGDAEKRKENNPDFDKMCTNMKVEIINEVDRNDDLETYIPSSDGKSFFKYIDDTLRNAKYKSNENLDDASKSKACTMQWRLEEDDNTIRFIIYTVDPTEENENKLDVNVTYEYPTKRNNVVRSFTPAFNFEKIWSSDIFIDSKLSDQYFIDQNGNVKSFQNITMEDVADNKFTAKSINTYTQAIQHSYEAEMTTLGIPADIPIGAVLKIRPIINGKEYHYAGRYMITKTTDRIDTNGYTTEYTLFKLVGKRQVKQDLTKEAKDTVVQNMYPPGFIGPIPPYATYRDNQNTKNDTTTTSSTDSGYTGGGGSSGGGGSW